LFKNVLAKDKTIGARINAISPFIAKPGARIEANHRQNPFTTKEKIPRVKKVIGKDKAVRIGLMKALTNPMITPATSAEGKLAISTPGTTMSTTSRLNAVAKTVNKYPIIFFLLVN
jgi:hypothetical protein